MLSVLAHVEIFAPSGALPDWRLTAHESLQNASVRAVTPYVDTQALRTHAGNVTGVALRDEQAQATRAAQALCGLVKTDAVAAVRRVIGEHVEIEADELRTHAVRLVA